ncbi:MAG TPA: patatin-like phospholipase family protein [Actinomycetota bacterium]|nr:patatin-like phospholipase family protein [Actinomycetota bacterium]
MTFPGRCQPSRAQWLRRLAARRQDRVAFVLSGGGPLGALQVGALKALYEHEVVPDLLVGTSVGAINATFLAFNPGPEGPRDMEKLWLSLTEADLFPPGRFRAPWARFLARGDHVFENTGLRRVVERRIGTPQFEDARVPLGIVATELDTGAERTFTSGPVIEPLLASTAMPSIYPPVEIGGVKYIDGGVANNVPIAPAIALGAKTIYVMNSTSHSHQRRPLIRPIDYLLHAFSLARSQRMTLEQTFLADKVKLVMVPTPSLDYYVPFQSMQFTEKLVRNGYEHTMRFLSGRRDAVVQTYAEGAVEAISPAK